MGIHGNPLELWLWNREIIYFNVAIYGPWSSMKGLQLQWTTTVQCGIWWWMKLDPASPAPLPRQGVSAVMRPAYNYKRSCFSLDLVDRTMKWSVMICHICLCCNLICHASRGVSSENSIKVFFTSLEGQWLGGQWDLWQNSWPVHLAATEPSWQSTQLFTQWTLSHLYTDQSRNFSPCLKHAQTANFCLWAYVFSAKEGYL